MFEINITQNAFVFVDAKRITPQPATISQFMSALSRFDMMPSVFQEFIPGSAGPLQRLQFTSISQEFVVQIASDRLVLERKVLGMGENLKDIRPFLDHAEGVFSILLPLVGKKSTRVALNLAGIYTTFDSEKLSKFYSQIFNPLPSYPDSFEWSARFVRRQDIDLPIGKEACNVISAVERVAAEMVTHDDFRSVETIKVSFDINTIPQNQESRLDALNLRPFLEQAATICEKELAQILERS